MIFVILYILSFAVILYYNYFEMRGVAEKSSIARGPSFFVIYLIFTYGSIAGLWFKYNWKIALIALMISWSINKFSFRIFFRNYINKTVQKLIESDWFDIELPIEDRIRNARYYAEKFAYHNATGKWL